MTKYTNETVPLVLSLVACFLFGIAIIVAGYFHGNMHLLTTLKKMLPLLNIFLAVTLWVQVPQWSDDWSHCAVDVPDSSCHWYIVNADNTFGEGFDWETAPWYSVEGLQDIANLHDDVLDSGYQYTMDALQPN